MVPGVTILNIRAKDKALSPKKLHTDSLQRNHRSNNTKAQKEILGATSETSECALIIRTTVCLLYSKIDCKV